MYKIFRRAMDKRESLWKTNFYKLLLLKRTASGKSSKSLGMNLDKKWPSHQAYTHWLKHKGISNITDKCRKSTGNLQHHCVSLTHMVSFEFLLQNLSATQWADSSRFTRTVLHQKTNHTSLLQSCHGAPQKRIRYHYKIVQIWRTFQTVETAGERIKPYSAVQMPPVFEGMLRVWMLFFQMCWAPSPSIHNSYLFSW